MLSKCLRRLHNELCMKGLVRKRRRLAIFQLERYIRSIDPFFRHREHARNDVSSSDSIGHRYQLRSERERAKIIDVFAFEPTVACALIKPTCALILNGYIGIWVNTPSENWHPAQVMVSRLALRDVSPREELMPCGA